MVNNLQLICAWKQRKNMTGPRNLIPDDGTCISEELIGRLHNATEESVLDLVAALTSNERANLAVVCYHKSHLRRIGLAIAATCDLNCLVKGCGLVLGRAIFTQSRDRPREPSQNEVRPRPKITLASSVGRYYPPPVEVDDVPQPNSGSDDIDL